MTLYAVVNGDQLNAVLTTTFTREAILERKYLQSMLRNNSIDAPAAPKKARRQKASKELES